MVKRIGSILGLLAALPPLALYVLARLLMGRERAFSAGSEYVAMIPGNLGVYARQAYYRSILAGVGRDVHFGFMSLLSKPDAVIGDRVYIGRFCSLGWVELGDQVMLADGVQVLSGRRQHGEAAAGATMHDAPQTFTKVTIGKGAWLGAGAVVMADVGEGAVVAAGAVVVKPVPAGAKVGGVPARPL